MIKTISVGRPTTSPATDEILAKHEAGHAVVATSLGLEVAEVYLTNNGHGMTAIYSDQCSDTDRRWALIGCAGSVTEGADWINEGDFARIVEAGFKKEDLTFLFEETKAIVDLNKENIQAVTKQLLKKRKISGSRLKSLIQKQYNMNKITKKVSIEKSTAKKIARQEISSKIKKNRAEKKAKPEEKAKRLEVKSIIIEKKTPKKTNRIADKLLAYSKIGFVKLTKAEIEQLSEGDRNLYWSNKSKEDRKNEKKSLAAKARRSPPRKRTGQRQMTRATIKADKKNNSNK
jgi:hypothetical protein